MATLLGTQEFMEAHKDHSTSISMLQTMDTRYITEIQKLKNGSFYAVLGEKDSREWVEDQGAYLCCHTCQVEEEINLGEVIED
jgi:hypothetical protein